MASGLCFWESDTKLSAIYYIYLHVNHMLLWQVQQYKNITYHFSIMDDSDCFTLFIFLYELLITATWNPRSYQVNAWHFLYRCESGCIINQHLLYDDCNQSSDESTCFHLCSLSTCLFCECESVAMRVIATKYNQMITR